MAKKKQDPLDPNKMKQFEALIAKVDGMDIQSGFGFPYCSINGNMCCFMAKTGSMGIRLPKEDREKFLVEYNTVLFENHNGPVMKEYVQVPDELVDSHDVLLPYLEKSIAFVRSLKPKPKKK